MNIKNNREDVYEVPPEYIYTHYEFAGQDQAHAQPQVQPQILPQTQAQAQPSTSKFHFNYSDTENSVKEIIKIEKDEIENDELEKEKQLDSDLCIINQFDSSNKQHQPNNSTNANEADQPIPPIGKNNRFAEYIVQTLERIYQNSSYVTSKRREEIAIELNLPKKKVIYWFQNRYSKDSSLHHLHSSNCTKKRCAPKCFTKDDETVSGGFNEYQNLTKSSDPITQLIEPSPKRIKESSNDSMDETIESNIPKRIYRCKNPSYCPPFEYNNSYKFSNVLTSSKYQPNKNPYDDELSVTTSTNHGSSKTYYEIVVDSDTNKTYTVLKDIKINPYDKQSNQKTSNYGYPNAYYGTVDDSNTNKSYTVLNDVNKNSYDKELDQKRSIKFG